MDRESQASRVIRALRRVNLEGSIFGQNVAIRFGLSESDVETLERLAEIGSTTAGHLSELMGLSTGAVTRVLDRLEQAGYIRRSADPADRRRVIVSLVAEKAADVEALTNRLATASASELARYTDDQLDAIADFLGRMSDVTRAETTALREAPEPATGASPSEHGARLAGLSQAQLVLRSGASELVVRGASGLDDLYHARFEGAVPQVRVRNGIVSIQYRSGKPWDWRRRAADIALNTSIPWTVSLTGGASKVTVDASALDLGSFEMTGGVDRLRITLGRPHGEAVVRMVGGANQVAIDRPADVPVRLHVRGGAGSVQLDGQRLGATVEATLTSPGENGARDRFSIEVGGGASRIAVTETGKPAGG